MKTLALAVGLFLLSTVQAYAALVTCGSGTTAMGAGSTETAGRNINSPENFSDCYSFSIDSQSDAFGGTTTSDGLSAFDIAVTSVTLSGSGLGTSLVDFTPDAFSFGNLLAGTYQLVVSGSVTRGFGSDDILFPLPVRYNVSLTTNIVTTVPEPASLALFALGLMGMAARRRRT